MVTNAIPLQDLPAGESASILRIFGPPDDVHRLEEFGIRRGTRVEMFRSGTPCILRIAGNKLCLRADEMLNVMVEPIAAMIRPKNGTKERHHASTGPLKPNEFMPKHDG